ncbi:unnamed protein product [Tilletia caries]|nr:unnamed protein product [Tilletia caries]
MSKLIPHTEGRTYSSTQLRALLVPKPPSPDNPSAPTPSGATTMPATAATASAAAPTRPSPPAVRSVRAAAQLALEGIEPTSDRCAAFIRNTLHSHVSRATGRTGRITLLADEVKHLLAASTFLLHQNEHDIISRIDKATAAIDAVAATQAATTTSLQELKEELSKPNISPPPQDSPPDIERDIGVWQTVKPRKRSKERKAPLAQRLPSTDMLITSANLKLPVFKGLSPKAVVTKARAAILSQRSKKSWEKVKEHPIEHIVRAARSLPSGDWILSDGTIGWANFLSMMKKDWIPALDPNARLKDANFEIAVHLMPRDFDTDNMEHVQEFWDQNPHSFHSSGFKWAGGPNDKKHGTLLLSFRRAADANELLKASVVWDHRMLETRRSVRRPNQCNRCQEFGHVAQSCKKEQKCGRCAGSHSTSSCACPLELPEVRCKTAFECAHLTFKCANCDGHHTANDRRCPTRERAYQAAREEELAEGDLFQLQTHVPLSPMCRSFASTLSVF